MDNSRGLEGVIAAHSSITRIDGQRGELEYRGYPVARLARAFTFEAVAWLLWHGELPSSDELANLRAELSAGRTRVAPALEVMKKITPSAHPLETIRAGVTALAPLDPDRDRADQPALLRQSIRLTGVMPVLAAAAYRFRKGQEWIAPQPGDVTAAALLRGLGGAPDDLAVRAIDACLTLLADHELNASTFTARVVAATESDLYSAIAAALCALKGPKHGGANQDVVEMLDEIGRPENAEPFVMARVTRYRKLSPEQRRGHAQRFPAFGHRVYKVDDPRAAVLREIARPLCAQAGRRDLFDCAESVREVVQRELGLPVNVDFYSAVIFRALGIAPELCTAIFAVARTAGWTAHVMEQLGDNRLIRPRAEYLGPATRALPTARPGLEARN